MVFSFQENSYLSVSLFFSPSFFESWSVTLLFLFIFRFFGTSLVWSAQIATSSIRPAPLASLPNSASSSSALTPALVSIPSFPSLSSFFSFFFYELDYFDYECLFLCQRWPRLPWRGCLVGLWNRRRHVRRLDSGSLEQRL